MALTPSNMPELGLPAVDFSLPDPSGRQYSLADFSGSTALLVAFWCNHCPFVKHLQSGFVDFGREYMNKGLGIVAINANDISTHPEDAPERMQETAESFGYPFPYLFDETQAVAQAYAAACTPDFFLYDSERRLVYRGQFDASRPGNDLPVSGSDLRAATDALLSGTLINPEQTPSIGCNIKWRAGNEPG